MFRRITKSLRLKICWLAKVFLSKFFLRWNHAVILFGVRCVGASPILQHYNCFISKIIRSSFMLLTVLSFERIMFETTLVCFIFYKFLVSLIDVFSYKSFKKWKCNSIVFFCLQNLFKMQIILSLRVCVEKFH